MTTTNEKVIDHIQRVINKILFLKKKSLFQYKGIGFYPSEIHLMLVIREKTATNATKIAEQIGVTKGAVSQTLARLEKKGVLTKTQDPYNKNELTVRFTTFGVETFKHYKKRVTEIFDRHNLYLNSFSEEEKKVIQRFLGEVEKVIDGME